MVNSLSGGMQRKLSVGIAFVGEANLVILDEPVSENIIYSKAKPIQKIIKLIFVNFDV